MMMKKKILKLYTLYYITYKTLKGEKKKTYTHNVISL